jgi:vacuolar-type H+-ATPase subunit C/Vma6
MNELITRARGLSSRELTPPEGVDVEHWLRMHAASDFATLARWSAEAPEGIAVLELDEDRRSLRAFVRALAAGITGERRRVAMTPTSHLREARLAALATATTIADARAILGDHPLAAALTDDGPAIDVFALEHALAHAFAGAARKHARDPAVRTYLSQLIDGDNACAVLELAVRGKGVAPAVLFIPGGERLDAATFAHAAVGPIDASRELLEHAFAGTPVAHGLDTIEDAILAWQLATQRHLRRTDPHGLAAVIYLVLHRREDARRLRLAAWRKALGGPS